MTRPKRIQLSRRKGWRKPEGTIVVARGTEWGNPYKVGASVRIATPSPWRDARLGDEFVYWPGDPTAGGISAEVAVLLFRIYVVSRPGLVDQIRRELGGHDLACWCPPDQPCHADVLLELANGGAS